MAGGAFAQQPFIDYVINGNCEGAQDPAWSCFWVQDGRKEGEPNAITDEASGQGYYGASEGTIPAWLSFADIVVDPLDPNNHCVKVVVRSEAEAFAAGNARTQDDKFADYDTQFEVRIKENIQKGDQIKLTMRIRAEKAVTGIGTQAHTKPGDYTYYSCIGNIDFTTEWADFESPVTTVSADMVGGTDDDHPNGKKEFHCVVLNLSKLIGEETEFSGNVYYFDDIKLEVQRATPPAEFAGWLNYMRKGPDTNDEVTIYDTDNKIDVVYPTFRTRDAISEDGSAGKEYNPGRTTETDKGTAYTLHSRAAEGSEEVTQWWGGTSMQYYYSNEEGEHVTINGWDTQFFVTIKHQLKAGEKARFKMWYKSDRPAKVTSQSQLWPGKYKGGAIGDLFPTSEWQVYEDEVTVGDGWDGACTFAFNCNEFQSADDMAENNYYFIVEEFSVNIADVTSAERVIGVENLILPVADPESDEYPEVAVDMTKALNALGATLNEVLASGYFVPTDGQYPQAAKWEWAIGPDGNPLNAQEGVINIGLEKTGDNEITFGTDNAGLTVEAGSPIKTTLAITKDGWFYAFNITLMNAGELAGIKDVKAAKVGKSVIYNLAGQRVDSNYKGLVIKDGKKLIQK